MSEMDINGNSMRHGEAGRYLAVLWFLFAALAMQFVLSAQGLSARASTIEKAGNFSVPDSGSSEHALTRPALRATPVADLRFSADRPDGKPMPGGTGPFLLPATGVLISVSCESAIQACFRPSARTDAIGHHIRVRAPPVARA